MTNAGYSSSQYTILVQDYPSPIPNGSEFRYTQSGYSRQTGGCGFWNTDANYANATMLPTIDSTVFSGRGRGPVEREDMELSSAFNSHRLCEKGVGLLEEEGLSNWKAAEAVNKSEWFNQIRTIETLTEPYGRHLHDLGYGTQLGRRAEHVAALIELIGAPAKRRRPALPVSRAHQLAAAALRRWAR